MIRLIVNADDFGQTPGINAGIVRAHREGILTSTTLLANGAGFDEAVALAKSNPELGVGVHLNLVEGGPLCSARNVPSLLDPQGMFHSKFQLVRRHLVRRLRLAELRKEVDAQIECILESGLVPTHVDSHKHIHAYPPFFRIVAASAVEHGIRAIRLPLDRFRLREAVSCPQGLPRTLLLNVASIASRRILRRVPLKTPDHFAGTLRTGSVTATWLRDWILELDDGTTELMVHPGLCDAQLQKTGTRLTMQRETELASLIDPGVINSVKTRGICLNHYGNSLGVPFQVLSSASASA